MSALDSIIRPIIKPILKPFLNERGRSKLYFIAKRSERNLFITAFICKLSLYKIACKLGLARKNPNGGGQNS